MDGAGDRLVECILRNREEGYSILQISMFCKCSTRRVRSVLKRYGDPLKRVRGARDER